MPTPDAHGNLHAGDGKFTQKQHTADELPPMPANPLPAIDAELRAIEEAGSADAVRHFGLTKQAVTHLIRDIYPTATTVILDDVSDGGSPYWSATKILDGDGNTLWTPDDDGNPFYLGDDLGEYTPALDTLHWTELTPDQAVVDNRQGVMTMPLPPKEA